MSLYSKYKDIKIIISEISIQERLAKRVMSLVKVVNILCKNLLVIWVSRRI
ncbi:CRPV-368 [Crowpox virus]|nr:CRPV-368 [Crowpox virus]